jgi:polyisoprenoid-binding protein YceI
MAKFQPVRNRSELALEGESSIHPLHTSTQEIEGYFEAVLGDDGQLDLSVAPTGRLEVYIEGLKSGNGLIDREMQRRLNTRRFPSVIAEVVEVKAGDGKGRYRASGDLTFHGVTRRLEDDLTISLLDDHTLEIKGEITIDVRNFNVDPPKLLMVKVHPEVKAKLQVVAKE